MPIKRDIARKAAANFRGMRMYPDLDTDDGKAVMASILDRLQEHATDDAHAIRATAKLRDSADFFPTPAAIVQACGDTRQVQANATASADCDWCRGTGWQVVSGAAGEGVRRCRCGGLPPLPEAGKVYDAGISVDEVLRQ